MAKGLVGKAVAAFSRCLLSNERGATSVQARCLYWLALALLRAVEKELGERGRALVRYSGTQKICRVMVEAAEEALVNSAVERLAAVITAAIGEAV